MAVATVLWSAAVGAVQLLGDDGVGRRAWLVAALRRLVAWNGDKSTAVGNSAPAASGASPGAAATSGGDAAVAGGSGPILVSLPGSSPGSSPGASPGSSVLDYGAALAHYERTLLESFEGFEDSTYGMCTEARSPAASCRQSVRPRVLAVARA